MSNNVSNVHQKKKTDFKSLALLGLAIFIDLLGFGIVIPVLPFFVEYGPSNGGLSGTPFDYSLLVGIYSLMQFLFAPIWGGLSDRIGRKPVILIGLFGSSIGFFLFGLSTQLWMLYVARIVGGFFASATIGTSYAVISDVSSPESRAHAFGILGVAFGLGFTFGPAVGGVLSTQSIFGITGFALPAFFASGLALINMISAAFYLPESLPKEIRGITTHATRTMSLSNVRKILTIPQVGSTLGLLILLFATFNLAFSMFELTFPVFAIKVNNTITSETIGGLFFFIGIIIIIVQGGVIRPMVKKYGEKVTMFIGMTILFIGYLVIPYIFDVPGMLLVLIPFAIGEGLTTPSLSSLLSKEAPIDKQGLIFGINQGISSLMRICGTLSAGILFTLYFQLSYWVGSIILFSVIILALLKLHNLPELERKEYENIDLMN